jgi:hypothetical protein
MNRLLLIMIVAFAVSAHGGIDLTPSPSEYTAEGITFRQLSFTDGKRRVVYELPRQWTYRGGGSSLQLAPAKAEGADASIQVSEIATPQPFDEKLFAALKEQSLRTAPAGAQNATVISEEINPVRLERGEVYGVTISYQTLGETFHRCTLYVNLPDTRLTFRLTARKKEFESLNLLFRASVLSWHWTDQSPGVPKNEQIMASAPAPQRPSATN